MRARRFAGRGTNPIPRGYLGRYIAPLSLPLGYWLRPHACHGAAPRCPSACEDTDDRDPIWSPNPPPWLCGFQAERPRDGADGERIHFARRGEGPVVCSAGAIDGQDGLVRGRAGCQGHGRHVYLQPLPLRHPLEGFHRCCGQGILGEGRRLRRHLFQLDGDAPPGRPRRDGAGCHRRGVPLPLPLRRDAGGGKGL